jgi:hypothetical protein
MTITIRSMVLEEVRPFDWVMLVVEVLVLLLILYEVFVGVRDRREQQRRNQVIRERVAMVRHAMQTGQELQRSSPRFGHSDTDRWYQAAKKWTEKTRALLKSYSLQAEASFVDVSDMPPVSAYGGFAAPQEYGELLVRIGNLRGIMEKPDVYL